jgi:hypothetical protein
MENTLIAKMSKKSDAIIFIGKQECNLHLCRKEAELFIRSELHPFHLKYSRDVCIKIFLPSGNTSVI